MSNARITFTPTRGNAGTLGIPGVLTIVFVVLKLTGLITWSWLWVLSPLWISLALALAFFLLLVVIAVVVAIVIAVRKALRE